MDCPTSFYQTSQAWKESQDLVMMMEMEDKMDCEEITQSPCLSWPTPDLLLEAVVPCGIAEISPEEYRLALESVIKPEPKDAENDFSEFLIYPSPYTPSPVQSTESKSIFFLPTFLNKKTELDPQIKQQIDQNVKSLYTKYCELKQGLQETYFRVASEEKQFLTDLQRAITEMIQIILQRFGNGHKMHKELTAHLNYIAKYALLVTRQPSPFALCDRKESQIEVALLISPELISSTNNNITITLVNENKIQSAKIGCNNEQFTKSTKTKAPEVLELKKDRFGIGYFAQANTWRIIGKKPKRTVKGTEKDSSIFDESFHLQFKCDVHLNGYGTYKLETYSFPFKILTNISQKDKAIKSLVWERAAGFFGRDIYKIHQKKQCQSLKFGKLAESIRIFVEQETGRAVSENDVLLIGRKFFGEEINEESNITLHQYRESRKIFENELSLELYMEKEFLSPNSPSKRKRSVSGSNVNKGISFVEWFLLLAKFLRSDDEYLNLWTTGQMFSYLSREQNLAIFSPPKVGAYLIRLSMSSPVAISIDWVVQGENKTEVECLRWPRKDKDTSMSEHKLSVLIKGFQNTCWKDFKTWAQSAGTSQNKRYIDYRRYVSKEIRFNCEFV